MRALKGAAEVGSALIGINALNVFRKYNSYSLQVQHPSWAGYLHGRGPRVHWAMHSRK